MKNLWLFYVLGISAVVIGGMLSAFMAHSASYLSSWAVAYTVLVLGVAQVAIGEGLRRLPVKKVSNKLMLSIIVLFNIGGLAVIVGTTLKTNLLGNSYLVYVGCLIVAAALMLCLRIVRGIKMSGLSVAFYVFIIAMLGSVIVGMFLA